MINNNGADNIFAGHVVRGERLNPWFPLDRRFQNSSGLANGRAFYLKVVTNVIEY